jgi:hypothetical protein
MAVSSDFAIFLPRIALIDRIDEWLMLEETRVHGLVRLSDVSTLHLPIN